MDTNELIREWLFDLLTTQWEIEENGGTGNWENAQLVLKHTDLRYKIADTIGLNDTRENMRLFIADNPTNEEEIDKIMGRLSSATTKQFLKEMNYDYLEV